MRQKTINHRRVTRLVRSMIDHEIFKARRYYDTLKYDPDSEAAKAERDTFIPGIEFETVGKVAKEYVTVNDDFLTLIGYEDNLEGFLADYFGSDYKPADGQPLRFRYVEGLLINPTKVK